MGSKIPRIIVIVSLILLLILSQPSPLAYSQNFIELINVNWIRDVETVNGVLFPRVGLPAFVTPGSIFNIVLYKPQFTSNIDRIYIKYVTAEYDLNIIGESIIGDKLVLNVSIPSDVPNALFDLYIVSGGAVVEEPNAVAVKDSWDYPIKILRYSDTHYDNRRSAIWQRDNFLKLIWRANFINPDFIIITGDILNTATEKNFESFRVDLDNLLQVPLVLVPGNHDHHFKRDLFTYYVGLSNISLNVGPLHLILIDTGPNGMNGWIRNEQIEWLKEDLVRYSDYEVKIAASHHPFSMLEETPESNRSGLEAVLRNSDIDLILHGHMHFLMPELNMTPIRITDPNAYQGGQPYSGFRIIYVNGPDDIEWRYNGKVDPYPLFDFNVIEYQERSLDAKGFVLRVENNMEVDIDGYIDVALPLGEIASLEGISLSQLTITNFTDFMRIQAKIRVGSGEEKIVKIYLDEDREAPSIDVEKSDVKGNSLLLFLRIRDDVSGVSKVELKYSYDNSTWEPKDVYRLTHSLFYSEVKLSESGGVAVLVRAVDVEGHANTFFLNHSLILGKEGVETPPTEQDIENFMIYIAIIVIVMGVASIIFYIVRKHR